ncbi:MAG: CUAEP/CCAEP-tail radical SAM protein [Chloroflexota bacterium]
MNTVLISTYELGHQPFGLASPAAWLKDAGANVTCLDLAVEGLDREAVVAATLIAFYVPMHTATRLAISFLPKIQRLNPQAHICFYGLYAPLNEDLLRNLGVKTILGGEFETGLLSLYHRLTANDQGDKNIEQPEPRIARHRQTFLIPERQSLPPLNKYAYLSRTEGVQQAVGYTEASRGCKHLCRHCPVVPVYQGRFRIVQQDVVLADIAQQVEAGAAHITFGDPDFFNGPRHALALVETLHQQWPHLTYDVTIKVSHLLRGQKYLPRLRETGCLFVTSAVEAVNDEILQFFKKGHTRSDFIRLVDIFRREGLTLNPTFVAFNPWISLQGYQDFLHLIADLDLVENVAPIQYAIRLLIPSQSRLLELPEVREMIGPFDEHKLVYPWRHIDDRVDQLQEAIIDAVQQGEQDDQQRVNIFETVWQLTQSALQHANPKPFKSLALPRFRANKSIPHLSEPWYC